MLYDVWVDDQHVGQVRCNPWNNEDSDDDLNLGGRALVLAPNVRCVLVMNLVSEEPQDNGLVKRVFKVVE